METWTDIFWFPVINMAVLSGLAVFMRESGSAINGKSLVAGLILWFALEPASYSVAVGALWEIWSKSFSALFISPLTISEFIAGQMIFSLMKEAALISIVSAISYFIFGFSLLSLGPIVIVYILLMMLFGWACGCFILGLVLRFGTRIQSLAWGLIYAVQPFVGLYYPVDIFPRFVRYVSYALPPTYVYNAMRANLAGHQADGQLILAFGLNILYFLLGYAFMKRMWDRARRAGALARMEE